MVVVTITGDCVAPSLSPLPLSSISVFQDDFEWLDDDVADGSGSSEFGPGLLLAL